MAFLTSSRGCDVGLLMLCFGARLLSCSSFEERCRLRSSLFLSLLSLLSLKKTRGRILLQAKNCPYCLYCLLKKNKRAKNNPLVLLFIFCFLRFLYNRLFPIILVFSNCILYIGFSQLYWFFTIVFYILAFLNYIGFSQLYFIYWLFPIILYFSPIVFIQLL